MDKKLVIVASIIIIAVGGGLAYLAAQNKTETPTDTTSTTAQEPAATPSQGGSGFYEDYDEAKVAETEGTKILFFHAPWCPQCRALETDILNKGVPDGVTIFKVDYDSSQALRQKYEVTIQTTLVKVDDNGNMLEKFVAYSEPTLESVKQNLLQ